MLDIFAWIVLLILAASAIGVIGIATFSGQSTVPAGNAVTADQAVLGGPEYGSRQ